MQHKEVLSVQTNLKKNYSVNWALPEKPLEREKNSAFVVSSISSLRYWQTPPPTLVTKLELTFNRKVMSCDFTQIF